MHNCFLEISADSDFPIQNLPYGVFSRSNGSLEIGVAIGEFVLSLTELEKHKLISSNCFQTGTLNRFISCGRLAWSEIRQQIKNLLAKDCPTIRDNAALRQGVLLDRSTVQMQLPVEIPNYTDFYSSREHATNVGAMFRDPQNPLLPNWLHVPVAYHGRASSVVVSGHGVRRPLGQTKTDEAQAPSFEPTRLLDFELEMGCIIGQENQLGNPVSVASAHEHIFGMVLVNDWSARDIQRWEYVPLGPFLAKNFLTSISPWVVPLEALLPFRTAGPKQDPSPLPYLRVNEPWGFDIQLEASLKTSSMSAFERICHTNYKYMYWNICQQIAHHTSNGCNLKVGDLLASGTISGPTPDSFGSLLELTWRGTKPLQLKSGESRKFLQDGDSLKLNGYCQGNGYRIGFGEVVGNVLPAQVDERLIVHAE